MSSLAGALSIPIAAALSWLFGAAWYGALGHLKRPTAEPGAPHPEAPPTTLVHVFSVAAELVMATALAILIGRLGLGSAAGGMSVGILAWLGFAATIVGIDRAYRRDTTVATLVDAGHWLGVLLLQGLVIGGLS